MQQHFKQQSVNESKVQSSRAGDELKKRNNYCVSPKEQIKVIVRHKNNEPRQMQTIASQQH